ncbi:MAG: nicotinate-nucleotide adenylyltransferase [Crocinitomicaceae bacterium]|jgi:nicotinate-nucleotide adenylyltransferase|nr:nicotinate-nucleotide adenylyltransferase [Crocinitomicaceae bacterium]
MKKIGLYFGTFNPIHVGHLIIANHLANNSDLTEVWFVVSPHNPLKDKNTLLDDHHRLAMVQRAVDDNPKLKASSIEFDLPKPSYTVLTLQSLKEKFPKTEFSLIMGEDNLRTIHKWKNYEYILENFDIYVYPRVQSATETDVKDFSNSGRIHMCNAPVMNVSSTFIREAIKNRKDVRYLLTDPVFKYVDEMNFYK